MSRGDLVLHVEYELNGEMRESIAALIEHLSQWGQSYLHVEFQENGKQRQEDSEKEVDF